MDEFPYLKATITLRGREIAKLGMRIHNQRQAIGNLRGEIIFHMNEAKLLHEQIRQLTQYQEQCQRLLETVKTLRDRNTQLTQQVLELEVLRGTKG